MPDGDGFARKYAIVGLGVKAGHFPGLSARTLQCEAARLAIADAGLNRSDIDGAINGRSAGGSEPSDGGWADSFARILGLPVNFYWTMGRGGTAGIIGLMAAVSALETGVARYVVVARGDDNWSLAHGRFQARRMAERLYGELGVGNLGFSAAASAAGIHAFFASRHMHEYGTTSAQLGAVAVAHRQWACLNPEATMYRRPITIEDHQNSRWVVEPYHLLDCCLQNDAGVAYVITTAERARSLGRPPVWVLGVGFGEQIRQLWWDKTNYTQLDVAPARANAFRLAGIELGDVDVAEFYDCFTGEVIFQLEDYGWCKKGEGGAFVEAGHTRPGGSIPCNTGGGLLSAFYLYDYTGLAEGVVQMRGEGGERQVSGAEVCLVTGHGGEILMPSMASTHACLVLGR